MYASEASAALKLARAYIGSFITTINGVQLVVILPAITGCIYAFSNFFYSLKNFVTQLIVHDFYASFSTEFQSIFESDLYHLFSYCISFDTLGLVFNFFYFVFTTFVTLLGTLITTWAITKYWPLVTGYIYRLVTQITGG